MFRFIEKSFLKITQILGLLFATIVLVVAVIVSYNKIDVKADDKIDTPVVKFADYQKLIRNQKAKISKNLDNNQRFDKTFNAYIDDIVSALSGLSDNVIDKTDLKQKVKISSKVKLSQYPQSVSVAYVKSLAKLTNQVAIVDVKVNMDELVNWHDQSFFQQIKEKDKRNFLQVGPLRIEKSAYSTMWEVLAIFMLLVIMLAVLRIEQNTRK
ncbi:hypothetical protein BPUTSESOX_715 [uncultured Gammaproteobacteria bacterium]|jgi:preprotein translocase subunit SecG|uniref:hypothetical protein n=1 Tax=thiotrophic endosymbiont of Bathymodiolus puteoserpentis (Logatchev) TaxID=343240 RepID=UPI0010B6AA8F|nr:hypothetical protein [thiotrophic endosymbiont of Bathymodiolus puteoserpentis (Logatchev)]CAC9590680.1 hypothetical protein [uncultured Gammaproteobacteria bacterium]CAC9596321.1 hypothetical protein [uncultured Gammaproteobacteria bacterium]CAC9598257.1 hypothetical protein [uncultured Gammaproteobacteria bacterium]CAC9601353.1 hypothetical protein [uncultured Gammaproteobacteria bacterium]CAC9643236.1 hypothetical protein [uncultured Gammaproteobacteria bacterium]